MSIKKETRLLMKQEMRLYNMQTKKQKLLDLEHQIGDDPILELMKFRQIPLTRENYLAMNYPEGVSEMTAEMEETLPPMFQLKQT